MISQASGGLRTLNKLLRRLDAVASEGGRNAHAIDRRVLSAQLTAYLTRAAIVFGCGAGPKWVFAPPAIE
jgi:hypothetical protein